MAAEYCNQYAGHVSAATEDTFSPLEQRNEPVRWLTRSRTAPGCSAAPRREVPGLAEDFSPCPRVLSTRTFGDIDLPLHLVDSFAVIGSETLQHVEF